MSKISYISGFTTYVCHISGQYNTVADASSCCVSSIESSLPRSLLSFQSQIYRFGVTCLVVILAHSFQKHIVTRCLVIILARSFQEHIVTRCQVITTTSASQAARHKGYTMPPFVLSGLAEDSRRSSSLGAPVSYMPIFKDPLTHEPAR